MANPTNQTETIHLQCTAAEDGWALFSGKPLIDVAFLWQLSDLAPFGVDPVEGMELDLTYRKVMAAIPLMPGKKTFISEIVGFANVEVVWWRG